MLCIHLPQELMPLIEDIRLLHKDKLLPTTNRAIIVESVKNYHKKVVSNGRG